MGTIPPLLNAAGSMFTGRATHICALVLVAAAFALLVAVDVTAPVNHSLALFTVRNEHIQYNEGYPVIRFGTFGYCLQIYRDFSQTYYSSQPATADKCSPSSIGYNPGEALGPVSHLSSNALPREASLTKAMVLHPLATAFSFLVLVCAVFPRSLVPPAVVPLLSSVAALLVLVALICDLVLFGELQRRLVDGADTALGSFDAAMWLLLVAAISLVVSTVLFGGRWWFGRKLHGTSDTGAGVRMEQDQEEGKTERSSNIVAPLYEMDPGSKTGRTELSQGDQADRHELSGQDRGRVELEHRDRRFELPGDTRRGVHV
ncbi:pali-domain-containing protein [Hypoxylon sp. FL1857]|nr:pali-domain-containing protein [Hypoxylon sp. FL1857]